MKRKINMLLLWLLLVALVSAGCSKEETPYQSNDRQNYTVSVKYDANGGTFTTNTSVIVDSYDPAQGKPDGEGKTQIPLIPPESEHRGKNAFTAVNNGYFLAGWYTEREQTTASDGSIQYTYAGRWDFEKDRLTVDPGQSYSAETPVLTLYAAWIPLFEIEYYALDTGTLLKTETYDPGQGGEIQLPQWNTETGAIDMQDLPEREGFTYQAVYLDERGEAAVTQAAISHCGTVDEETATASNTVMKLYIDWKEGKWYKIYSAAQLAANASLDGCYEILADLDFAQEVWPTVMMYGTFTGKIEGNGHTIKNVILEQTNNSKTAAGLFGQLTETASLRDLTFQNVDFTIKAGTRVAGTAYGLLAGTVSEGALLENLKIDSGTLKIDSDSWFATDDFAIGLICGIGATELSYEGIACEAVGNDPEKIVVTVTDGTVTVTPAAENQ